jgi:hypothetical protein
MNQNKNTLGAPAVTPSRSPLVSPRSAEDTASIGSAAADAATSAHTPGPWTVKGRKMEARIYGNVEGGPVAVVPYVTEWASNIYDAANAALIAAAPDLLAALEAWQAIYNTREQNGDTLRDMRLTANKLAEAAIAKARK